MKVLKVAPSNHAPNLELWTSRMAMPTWDGKFFYFYDIDFPGGFLFSEIRDELHKLYKGKCSFTMGVREDEM